MPKLTLLLGRKTLQIRDVDDGPLTVGRDASAGLVIDNASVSRRHLELRKDGTHWVVEDLGSSNGTFVNGERISEAFPVRAGDEIGIGKFSLVFDKVVGSADPAPAPAAPMPDAGGTMQIKAHEIDELLAKSQQTRRAQLQWESGGQTGIHYLDEAPGVLVGSGDLCHVRVPKGPKHHVLFTRTDSGCEVRDLSFFGKMKVGGRKTRKARLKDGDVVEASGLKVTFADQLG